MQVTEINYSTVTVENEDGDRKHHPIIGAEEDDYGMIRIYYDTSQEENEPLPEAEELVFDGTFYDEIIEIKDPTWRD